MRTTLTIDDDVAAMIERTRRERAAARPKPCIPFRTQSVDLGRARPPSIDNAAETLAIAEGESFD
jgi:hypothetical protein